MTIKTKTTIEDLYNVPEDGKAEIIDDEVVRMSPTGDAPSSAGFEIAVSLRTYARKHNLGRAYTDNVGFLVDLPGRTSFSPDAAFYTGERTGMQFLDGAPIFAVEVRSKNDYGPQAEQDIATKRRDYFAAGTQVVWDVDLLSEDVVKVYRATEPETPTIYCRGEMAEAEPAVPGWEMPVDDLFT